MQEVLVLVAKGLAGGTLVVLFALIGEVVHPKGLAGIFSGAPSIALAGLLLVVASKGIGDARTESISMALAAGAFVTYCVVSIFLVERLGAVVGSLLAFTSWFAVAVIVYVGVLA